jgi:cytochrome c oxidase assembly factor CtaG
MTSPDTATSAGHGRALLWVLLGALAAGFGLLLGLFLGGAAYAPEPVGIPDPGPVVGWGLPISKIIMVAAGTLTIGFLVNAAFLQPSADGAVVTRVGRRDLTRASVSALIWSAGAVMTLCFTHATVLGKDLVAAMAPDLFFTYAFEVTQNIAFAFTAVVALVIAAVAAVSVRTGWAAVLLGAAALALVAPPINAHGTGLGDHSLAMTSGAVHAVAAALWVGGLVVMAGHALRGDPGLGQAIHRFSALALGCVAALLLSGLGNAYARLEQPSDLLGSGYGALVLLKVALLGTVLWVAWQSRKAAALAVDRGEPRRRLVQWILIEGLLLALTVGVAVSMTLTAYPRAEVPLPSPAEELLGFPFPAAPAPQTVVFGWYPDVFFLLVATTLAALYIVGLVALRRRGVSWHWGRTIAWFCGVLALVWTTSAGIAAYSRMSVEWHMVQHMALSMVVPILLVLGMPGTLALRSIRPNRSKDRGPREWVLWGLHSGYSKLMTQPLVVLFIGTVGLFALYFTPLFGIGMSTHVGHVLMGVHFLFAGFLFYWVVVGLDPGPRQVPPWARLLLLLVFISLHAFFAIAIMSMTQPLAPEWFAQVRPPWITDAVRDTVEGGSVAWGFGELPTLLVMIAVSLQWARSDDRTARRLDRQADRDGDAELTAYNERLARMAERANSAK